MRKLRAPERLAIIERVIPEFEEMLDTAFREYYMWSQDDLINLACTRYVHWWSLNGRELCDVLDINGDDIWKVIKRLLNSRIREGKVSQVEDCYCRFERSGEQYKHCIYRFISHIGGEIIYVGRAKDIYRRMASHNHLPEMCYIETYVVEYVSFPTEDDLDIAERYYIAKYQPEYNQEFKNKHYSFSIRELDEKKWVRLPGGTRNFPRWSDKLNGEI